MPKTLQTTGAAPEFDAAGSVTCVLEVSKVEALCSAVVAAEVDDIV